tara:strand:- start:49 stop:312 length:264 start_codon:yes stop_codon:yes gene_type:complete
MITFSKYALLEIHKYTDINEHSIARAYTSYLMGENDLSKEFTSIAKRQDEVGYLTDDLNTQRNELNKKMNTIGKQKVSNWSNVVRFL